ncbi:MAG: glutamine-hydrolyzing GMP synthase, partial [Candidatus Hydrothermae bacterium]|nr:glutamine-hydrolyzing GMP synthase [Candidatus Hydrothermae bacterium]
MTPRDWVVILDFGSQYTKLIARRMRELGVFSRIEAPDWRPSSRDHLPGAVVLSGGPQSVYDPGAPRPHPSLWTWDLPVLGICYGMQWMAQDLGGRVAPAPSQEYGPAELHVLEADELFASLPQHFRVWMSHGDRVESPPPGFAVLASTEDTPIAAMGDPQRRRYGLQFHPEVSHTQFGRQILQNFLTRVAGLEPSWDLEDFVSRTVQALREPVGDR